MNTTPSFEKLVFFGDSWTDPGNLQAITDTLGIQSRNPEIFSENRSSDGFKYADYLADHIGIDGENVENLAFAGAAATTERTVSDFLEFRRVPIPADHPDAETGFDLSGQINGFLSNLEEGEDLSGTAVSLLIGGNDILLTDYASWSGAPEEEAQVRAQEIFDVVLAQAGRLADVGVSDVFLYSLPNFGRLPIASVYFPAEIQAVMPMISDAFNELLMSSIGEFEALGVSVTTFDFGSMFAEIADDFTSFGFRTFDDPITLDLQSVNPAIGDAPWDQIALVDNIHTSDAFEQVLARYQEEALTSDVQIGGSGGQWLRGGRQDDLIVARGGDDFVFLGKGHDVGLGGTGDDIIVAGRGNDIVGGGSGDDLVKGGGGDDVLADNHGDDTIFAGRGDDIVIDGAGSDRAFGGRGDDVFIFTDQVLFGGDSSADINLFVGGRGDDMLILRLATEDAQAFNDGTLTLENLGIETRSIENVVAVDGLDISPELVSTPLFDEADQWGLI